MSGDPFAASHALRLYVGGSTRNSTRALENLKRFCDQALPGRYELEVVDVFDAPERAIADDVVATPTLLRLAPEPRETLIGDLSDSDRLSSLLGGAR